MNRDDRDQSRQVASPAWPWVTDGNAAILTDLYELTMLQAYSREGMVAEAVFSLFVRELPPGRNFLVACGLDAALHYLETVRFDEEALEYLRARPEFSREFISWLAAFRFTGDVYGVVEGTPVFAGEPILEVIAPMPEAQLAESFVMNQVHFQTIAASKAARVVLAADGRRVVDFGMRRMHGADAALKGARAFYVAGVDATSNVLAGLAYGIPIAGTMAHSYIQAHASETEAFRAFLRHYPGTILLVDTYDTLEGVRRVVALARELGPDFQARGIRLDSGDLGTLARESRAILDAAGLTQVEIFASGGLDEFKIRDLVATGAPIDGFGVGSAMGASADAPTLDIVYKLTEYAGQGRLKLSTHKEILPGRKQTFRIEEDGRAVADVIARAGEPPPPRGRALLHPLMRAGRRLAGEAADLGSIREHTRRQIAALPARLRGLDPAEPPYAVSVSDELRRFQHELAAKVDG